MKYQFAHGGAVSLTAPSLHAALSAGLKSLLVLTDARFASLDVAVPQIIKGQGIATALASLAAGTASGARHSTRIKDAIAAVEQEITAEVQRAKNLVDQADSHNALLRQCAAHIQHGNAIHLADLDPTLAEAAITLRKSFLLGDPNGTAQETINVLNSNADTAAAEIATVKDFVVRKMAAAIRIARLNQSAQKLLSASISANMQNALCEKADRNELDAATKQATRHSEVLKAAYGRAFLATDYRRPPKMRSIEPSRLVRRAKNWSLK